MSEYNPETQEYIYLAGVLTKPGIREAFHIAKAWKESGFEYDGSVGGFEMEYYSFESFYIPLEGGDEEFIIGFYFHVNQRNRFIHPLNYLQG